MVCTVCGASLREDGKCFHCDDLRLCETCGQSHLEVGDHCEICGAQMKRRRFKIRKPSQGS